MAFLEGVSGGDGLWSWRRGRRIQRRSWRVCLRIGGTAARAEAVAVQNAGAEEGG